MDWHQLLLAMGCLATTIQSEWMTWDFNTTVNPCDNFYNYICPYIKNGTRAKREAPKSTSHNGMDINKQLRKIATQIALELKLVPKLRKAIEWYTVTVAEFETEHNQTLSDVIGNAIEIAEKVTTEVEKMIKTTSWRNGAPDPNPLFPKAATIGEQHLILLNTTTNMRGSWTGNDLYDRLNTVKKVLELVDSDMETLNVTGALAQKVENERFFSYIEKYRSDLGFWGELIDILRDLIRISKMPMMDAGNAFVDGANIITVQENLLLRIAGTALTQAWFANVAMVYGHETFHTFFGSEEIDRATPVKKMNETISCVEKKAMEACKEDNFGQDLCMSGPITWSEDVADLEGFRAAYKAYEKEFELLLGQQVTTTDKLSLHFNYRQLFFIAISKFNCAEHGHYDHLLGKDGEFDIHSTMIIRINLVFSQMEEFRQAFKCKAGDKMVQNDVCRAFGDELLLSTTHY